MKVQHLFSTLAFLCLTSVGLAQTTTVVNSISSFGAAYNAAEPGDTIVWANGTYSNVYMDIEKDGLTITADTLGHAIFNGTSRLDVNGDNVNIVGLQYYRGDIGTNNVINVRASNVTITDVNIEEYTCYKYLRVREESQYVDIAYCNFENRLNYADQNILSLLVSSQQPGYHTVRYCSFKNFPGGGNDEGVEPIRIGVSTQADFNSRSLVEYCYFTACDGDGEIISSKASQNVYRYNTFEDNTKAELVLRHGSENIVYGNFFLRGKGGVRVREGQDQYIYNNYFQDLADRAIFLQNEDDDPLDNINVAFNTFLDCDDVRLGGDGGSTPPTNVTFANNIFAEPKDRIFRNPTGEETWLGNVTFGELGITRPASGLVEGNPMFNGDNGGLPAPDPANAVTIDAAEAGFPELPQFEGMDPIDIDVSFDIMQQARPAAVGERDLGANEAPYTVPVSPFATEDNTGPRYTIPPSSTDNGPIVRTDAVVLYPNPASGEITVQLAADAGTDITLQLLDATGRRIAVPATGVASATQRVLSYPVGDLANGLYTLSVTGRHDGRSWVQTVRFVKTD